MNQESVERVLNLPIEQRASALLALPENQWYDRKSGRMKAKDLARHIVAFANAEGGVVALGLNDGRLDGVTPEQSNSFRQIAVDHIRPPLRLAIQEFEAPVGTTDPNSRSEDVLLTKTVMILRIDPSPSVYETSDGTCYLRVGDETRRLTYAQRRELEFDRGHESFDGTQVHATIEDLDAEQLANYASSIGSSNVDAMLTARNLRTYDGALTVAADLLFGSQPQREFPSAEVRVLRYDDNSRGTGTRMTLRAGADHRFSGSIPDQINHAAACIQELMPFRQALDPSGRFEAQPIIPKEAWMEGLVNAVVHRSYSISGDHIRIELFPNRIEISSPGRFPGLVNPLHPLDISRYARNPRIARVCSDLGITRELGEGIRRIVETMRARGLSDPVYEQTASTVHLTLMAADAIPAEIKSHLSPIERRTLDVLRRARQPLSTGEVAQALGIARPSAGRHLRKLRDIGLVEWKGQSPRDPRASWLVS